MTDGNTYAINKHLDEREDYDALQAELWQVEGEADKYHDAWHKAEARVVELEAKLAKAVTALEFYGGWSDSSGGICGFDGGSLARTTIEELKGKDDE